MGQQEKLLARVLSGTSDANINFKQLCRLLQHLGFRERVSGSHHNFAMRGVRERINLQEEGSHAKAYHVEQVRDVIQKYGLTL